mmetsp:Transcript_9238/g.20130  ORF Transcript_9238/g.20130 Transcript_9238/m.20130 type:complete len:124 (+) Transcript_9238:316-687(+)
MCGLLYACISGWHRSTTAKSDLASREQGPTTKFEKTQCNKDEGKHERMQPSKVIVQVDTLPSPTTTKATTMTPTITATATTTTAATFTTPFCMPPFATLTCSLRMREVGRAAIDLYIGIVYYV